MMHSPQAALVTALVAIGSAVSANVVALAITPSDITAITVAATALVTAIGAVIVNIMSARATGLAVAQVHTEVKDVSSKTDVIKGSVDGAASASIAEIRRLQSALGSLREQLAEKRETAALLAQAASHPPSVVVVPAGAAVSAPGAPVSTADASLTQIDANTL